MQILVAKRCLRTHPRRAEIFRLLKDNQLASFLPDNTALSQQVESFGGIIALLAYEVYLDVVDPKVGKVYDGYDQW